MNNEPVYRTGPATPGLLIISNYKLFTVFGYGELTNSLSVKGLVNSVHSILYCTVYNAYCKL